MKGDNEMQVTHYNFGGRVYPVLHRVGTVATLLVAVIISLTGCSIRHFATTQLADALAESGSAYATDEDIDLVGAATPFGLKTIESLLESTPDHRGLLLAAAKGFTQYAYAYVQLPADELEHYDVSTAYAQRERARRLYLRARDYGLRGLAVQQSDFVERLRSDPRSAVAVARPDDVALLYWTGVAWAAAISLGKDDPFLVADLPVVVALIMRAYDIDDTFDHGALHVFLISYEMSRRAVVPDAAQRARDHFDRAVKLSNGLQAAPYVALAEAVAVQEQNRNEFMTLLGQALDIDINARADWRLVNLIMQRRARALLVRTDEYFTE